MTEKQIIDAIYYKTFGVFKMTRTEEIAEYIRLYNEMKEGNNGKGKES